LAEVVKHIHKKFVGQQGIWSNYVQEHLLPRLNGFELLMASYAMAHLQLDLLLKETGATNNQKLKTNTQRLRVYLTNSLEESHPDTGTLFANWLSSEANEANHIKRDTPVMCVIGNPPYAVSSTNKNEWIQNLITDYKKGLNERKINLDDDYIKFIRYGQHFIDKNGSGILAYISNNSFIDGITHRQMRKNLVSSFDKIYIIDLHGNSSKKEKDPNGGADENVFDIQQGVSINIFIKNKGIKKSIQHFDLFGKREFKYDFLNSNNLNSIRWNWIKSDNENCFFTSKDLSTDKGYLKYISIADLMPLSNSGIQTKRDAVNIHFNKNDAQNVLNDFKLLNVDEIKKKYDLPEDGRDWTIEFAKKDIQNDVIIHKEQYRPFDYRFSFYTGKSKGIVAYPRQIVSKHIIGQKNDCICLMRQFFQDANFSHILYTNKMVDERTMYSNRGGTYIFPLYLYPETTGQQIIGQSTERTPNLNTEIVKQIADKLGLTFTTEKETTKDTFAPIDILDYIYAVLHSPSYREKYKEFLKIDFPRVPYPKDVETFNKLTKLGSQLRKLHLLESDVIENYITQYPIDGNNIVTKPRFVHSPLQEELKVVGKVYINDNQYFDNVPEVAWNFYIGGYQPAQKWLKDRKERTLEFDDILHYQKIIVALTETDRLMKEIDIIEIE
jgi:predicted helicase